MIRNILSSNGKSLGITDILPQYGEDYRLSVMDGTVDYRTIPLGAYDLFKQGSSKQDYLADIEKIKTMGFNTYQLSFGLASSRQEKSGDPMLRFLLSMSQLSMHCSKMTLNQL